MNLEYSRSTYYGHTTSFSLVCRQLALAGVALVWIFTTCSAQLNQDTFLKEHCSYSTGDRSPLAV